MSTLVVVAYPNEYQAEEVRLRLLQMQKEYLVDLEDAAIAVRKENGKIKLRQLYNLTGASALTGGFWGLLVGLIFLNPLLGVAVGAGAGAVSGALADVGVNDKFMKDLAAQLKPGGSMLFILCRSISLDKALAELEGTGGTIIRTSLSHEDEDRLRGALSHGAPHEAKPEKARQETPKVICCAASKEPPAYYNNTFEKAHSDPAEREAVYGYPSHEAEKALEEDAAHARRCTDDAEAAVSRNASPNSNLHCKV
ncbi:MAG: DUF1269 domain-containing protein [Mailhella sp.]|nr:DUF1269 domain-containing protein [Mailhella sp.]